MATDPEPSSVSAVKIPIFNHHDPALWFAMCESTFQLGVPKVITESRTKFNYVVSHLPPETASLIRDVLMNPDGADPYLQLKTELIKRSGESSHQEIRRLLQGEQLGDRKPSELLRVMLRRAENHNVPNELMLELFLQHLPSHVQTVLTAITPLTLEKAAEVADRVVEVSPFAVDCYGDADSSGRRKREIPKFLPHYSNEAFEVEISAFLKIEANVEGEIIIEESTNDTLDMYDTEYSSGEFGEIVAGGLTANSQTSLSQHFAHAIILTFCLVFTEVTDLMS